MLICVQRASNHARPCCNACVRVVVCVCVRAWGLCVGVYTCACVRACVRKRSPKGLGWRPNPMFARRLTLETAL